MKALSKINLKHTLFVLSFIFCVGNIDMYAQRDRDPEPLMYEIYSDGVGAQGTYLIKVYLYTKKVKHVNDPDLKKAAIHGVLFRGFSPLEKGGVTQKPLLSDPSLEQSNASYFDKFFSNDGTFMHFATIVPNTYEVVKSGRKAFKYKICVTAQVHKDALRKEMEKNGIIKSLSSVFNK